MSLSTANNKIAKWREFSSVSGRSVKLSTGVDVTIQPSVVSPLEIIDQSEMVKRIVDLPSVSVTAFVSAAFGMLVGLLAFSRRGRPTPGVGSKLRRFASLVARWVVILVLSVVYARWVQRRFPHVNTLSKYLSVADSTFASTPEKEVTLLSCHRSAPSRCTSSAHWEGFSEEYFNGDCLVLDVTGALRQFSPTTNAITVEVVKDAVEKLPDKLKTGKETVWRLLFITNVGLPAGTLPSASLTREAIEYLHQSFPMLLLLAVDSPSLMGKRGSPTYRLVQDALLLERIATLENVNGEPIRPFLSSVGYCEGALVTTFSRTEYFHDSRGCSVTFYGY
ncbi:hypothetical protein, conserved [Angomonas deanei]|uniref:Uncharacterized protein n=1 Tax=Angomonas deanei TaxID=59799 RepID=A0A7G2CA22_9TRYP|nr:hypothetical protein, conserved [Angomonas deanei]